jgi:hypothetical protein
MQQGRSPGGTLNIIKSYMKEMIKSSWILRFFPIFAVVEYRRGSPKSIPGLIHGFC